MDGSCGGECWSLVSCVGDEFWAGAATALQRAERKMWLALRRISYMRLAWGAGR